LLKAAIYDPQFLSSAGIKIVLEHSDEVSKVILLDTNRQLSDQIKQHQPDLLILEYLGDSKGTGSVSAEVVKQVKSTYSKLKVLIISEDDDSLQINQHISSGVNGFLTKNCSVKEIEIALETIRENGKFYCQKVLNILSDPPIIEIGDLSEREMQIIKYVGRGMSSSDIATKLLVSIHTVNSHRKNILKKLGLKSPTELIIYAVEKGWIKPKSK
jgi:DNA-binding NarL/FixJ family response regulator